MSFFKKLKRRNVIRVSLTYAVAAWLLVDVMDLLTATFEAPLWVMKVFIGVVLLGTVPVVILSWVYEITPEGIKKEATDHPRHAPETGRKLDIAILAMLTVVIGLFVAEKFSRDDPVAPGPVEGKVTARKGPPMLAVLPFASQSLGGDSEFFAAGVHDDLLTQLAQLAGDLSYANFGEEYPELIQRAEQVLEQIHAIAPGSADYLPPLRRGQSGSREFRNSRLPTLGVAQHAPVQRTSGYWSLGGVLGNTSLPYYDSMRDEPLFVDLLADLDDAAINP